MSHMQRMTIGVVTLLCGLAVPRASSAQDPTVDTGEGPTRVFGGVGQLALSSDVALLIQRSSQDATTVQFAPAADYFVFHNLSIGGVVLFNYTHAKTSDVTRFSIGPRVGYNIALTDMLSIWPKLGFSYSHTNASRDVPNESEDVEVTRSTPGDHFTLNLFAPVMFHPVPHFFVGFGPFLDADLSGDNRATLFGGRLALGGWFEL